jgi:rhodanese-related sulfurtransferase
VSGIGCARVDRAVVGAAIALAVGGCARHIGRAELLQQIDAGAAPLIVDVRSRGEYETSHVPGAVHIPFYSILARSGELPASSDPDQPLVVYCEHGPRAGLARAGLWFASDRPVRFLDGHMTAWKRDGLRVEALAPPGELAKPE